MEQVEMSGARQVQHLPLEVVVALDPGFLETLRVAGLTITQHRTSPRPDAWYFSTPAGEDGPFPTPEAALVAGVARMSQACRGSAPRRPASPPPPQRVRAS